MRRSMLAVAAAAFAAVAWAAPEKLAISGSSTINPVVDEAAKEFAKAHPDVSFDVKGGGSSAGVKGAASGQTQIGMASRDLKAEEKEKTPDLLAHKIAMDGVAVIVNAKNPVKGITKKQLCDVYCGRVTNWKDLGGEDAGILLVSKEEGRSTLELFLEYCHLEAKVAEGGTPAMVYADKGSKEFSKVKAEVIGANKDALVKVTMKPNAIAYVSVGDACEAAKKGNVKCLDLEGVAGTVENVSNGTYPLRRPLNLVTKGEPAGAAKEFIAYLLGAEGQKIVVKHGFVPLK